MNNTLIKHGERVTKIVPPNIEVMMTRCAWVDIASGGRCCATYTDGEKEYATVKNPDRENFFALVSQIQDEARK